MATRTRWPPGRLCRCARGLISSADSGSARARLGSSLSCVRTRTRTRDGGSTCVSERWSLTG